MAVFNIMSSFERALVEPKINFKTPFRFQITAVDSSDDKGRNKDDDDLSVVSESTPDYDSETEEYIEKDETIQEANPFDITLYGVSEEGYSVSLRVTNFHPTFYIDIPAKCTVTQFGKFKECLLKNIKSEANKNAVKFTICEKGKLYGYTNQRKFKVLHVEVPNLSTFWSLRKVLQTQKNTPKSIKVPDLGYVKVMSYETNIEPLLRFFHARDIKPSGWVSIPAHKYHLADSHNKTTCQLSFVCEWSDISLYDKIDPAKQVQASWDIEATSSHGDFPLAIKGYEKVAMDAYNIITNKGLSLPNHSISLTELVEEALWPTNYIGPIRGMSDLHLKDCRKDHHTERIYRKPSDLLDKSTASAYHVKTFGEFVRLRIPAITPHEMWEDSTAKPEERVKILADYLASRILAELPVLGDSVIQIGTCLKYLDITGKPVTSEKHVFVLGSCAKIPGINVYPCKTERELLINWAHFIRRIDPDIMMGYNICGFDEHFVYDRYLETANDETDKEFITNLSRIPDYECKLEMKELTSAAMGQNKMSMMDIPGRIRIDLYHYIKRNYALDSYKLDAVASIFMSSEVTDCVCVETEESVKSDGCIMSGQYMKLICKSTEGLRVGQYITLKDVLDEPIDHKFIVEEVTSKYIICINDLPDQIDFVPKSWSQAKDDVHHKEIFRLHYGTAADRAKIAKYCVQDCDLVLDLEAKLRAYMNAMAMANVCSVPVSYIFTRGQGVKIESLIFKECAAANIIVRVLPKPKQNDIDVQKERMQDFGGSLKDDDDDEDEEESYEGAIVLKPKSGFYSEDDPVVVLDYASLYPSSMMSENISHDSLVSVRDYDLSGTWINATSPEATSPYDNIPGVRYIDIDYDILKPDPDDMYTARGKLKKTCRQIKMGKRICRYAQYPGGRATMGIILGKLLGTRKATRKLMEKEEKYSFMYNLLDMLQNAYKITANSLYGQLGSATSKIRCVPLAASTTAYGRKQIMYSKVAIETLWGDTPKCNAECVYGDTDSLFIAFRPKGPDGKRLTGWDAVTTSVEIGEEAGHLISSTLKTPQDFEFDKVFWPFVLLSKKRYVGHMYEEPDKGIDSYIVKSMGIALKRRDNAPIVKEIYGGAVSSILKNKSIISACDFIKKKLDELASGKIPLRKLTISKSLKATYANRSSIAHAVLADRIGVREPGNAPQSGDRMSFAYILPPKGSIVKTQGERIETIPFITYNKLKIDYMYYITNQILNPVGQFMAVMLESLPGFEKLGRSPRYYDIAEAKEHDRQIKTSGRIDERKLAKALEKVRLADVQRLLFDDAIIKVANESLGQRTLFDMAPASPSTLPIKLTRRKATN